MPLLAAASDVKGQVLYRWLVGHVNDLSNAPSPGTMVPPLGRNYLNLFVTIPGLTPPRNAHSIPSNPSRAVVYNVIGPGYNSNYFRMDGGWARFSIYRRNLNHTQPECVGASHGARGGFRFGGGPTRGSQGFYVRGPRQISRRLMLRAGQELGARRPNESRSRADRGSGPRRLYGNRGHERHREGGRRRAAIPPRFAD
jgi:hypothetical protein